MAFEGLLTLCNRLLLPIISVDKEVEAWPPERKSGVLSGSSSPNKGHQGHVTDACGYFEVYELSYPEVSRMLPAEQLGHPQNVFELNS